MRKLLKTFGAKAFISLALGASTVALAGIGPSSLLADTPTASAGASRMIPPAEFVKKANMRSPRLSPDGRYLAYLAGAGGKEMLVVMDLNDLSKPAKPILQAEEARESGDRTMAGFRWIGGHSIVMTIQSREDLGNGLGDFGRLVAYNVDTGKMIQQAWRGAGGNATRILYVDHDKGEYLLERTAVTGSTERWGLPEVVRVNVDTGEYTMVQRTNPIVQQWFADGDGVVRGGLNNNRENGKVQMLYRSNEKEAFHTVFHEADKSFTNGPPLPEIVMPGSDTAYVLSRKDGFTKAYKVDMSTLTFGDAVYATPGFDLQDIVTDYDNRSIRGYRTFDGQMRTVYTDGKYREIQGFMDELFGKGEATIVDSDRKSERLIIFAGGISKGGGFYLYDTKTAKIDLLNWQRTAIKDTPLNPVKAEWVTASDGTKLQVIVTTPRHRSGKALPVIIMPHGGPFGVISATNALEPWNQPLAEAGYVVIQPNYRGSGGYGRAFEQMGREPGGYGVRMQDDLTDVLNHYAASGLIDPKRACIMGWSYGGYASARGAQRDPGLWRCAVSGAGVYDMPLMNKWDASHLGKFSSGFQATSDNPEGISPASNTSGKWAPILIVAGKRDQRIPLEQSQTLVANLKRSGKVEGTDYRYIVQPQGTHNLPYDDVHIQWIDEALAWLNRFNPAYAPGDSDKPPA
ncbi:MAG: prolyl oligopeptidase family serine peptidase [Novosphingobium sp.]